MKALYITLYTTALILLIIVLLGGSISEPVFDSLSSRTLHKAGVKKEAIDSIDSRIDEAFFQVKKMEYQVEKFKSFITGKQLNESDFQRESNAVFGRNIYNPLISMLNYIYRFVFFLLSLMLLLAGAITHVVYRNMELRRRVNNLEKAVYG
ncbi:MAG: hypothetical protein EHM58_12565 [Ignavibacteriae bacterium]|nr:MAG: hypothetical protein EHM58_12565 [Ignavibacteriota bacterium]